MKRREIIQQFVPNSPLVRLLGMELTAAARGKDLTAIATVSKRGRSIVFSDVRVTEPDGRLAATGSVVQRFG